MGIVTADISVTLDGYGAGPNQRLEAPFGDFDDDRLHAWQLKHAAENKDEVAGITEADAYVMGRNMFVPGRGEWDPDWKGWWGEEPPYHAPVFVLTHYAREPLPRRGGTTFHFVTDGITSALAQARAAAGSGNVSIAGGATTINQFLAPGLIDELRLHVPPQVPSGVTADSEPETEMSVSAKAYGRSALRPLPSLRDHTRTTTPTATDITGETASDHSPRAT